MPLVLVTPRHPLRPAVSAFVRSAFANDHGAQLAHLPERIVACIDAEDRPRAAVGMRDAAEGFFSACYLDEPVERALAAAAGRPVTAEEIVELGALASGNARALLLLLRATAMLALKDGRRWLLFTGTGRLREAIVRSGAELLDLGGAERCRVAEPHAWGRYYETAPRVCAVSLCDATGRLGHAHAGMRELRP